MSIKLLTPPLRLPSIESTSHVFADQTSSLEALSHPAIAGDKVVSFIDDEAGRIVIGSSAETHI